MTNPPSDRVKYVAELPHVREASILGSVDLGFWKYRLSREGLEPVEFDGRGRMVITATDSRFMGVKFRELIIAVFARRLDGSQEGLFLSHAYNSVRFFAFVERIRFSTPYYPARIDVEVEPPVLFQAVEKGTTRIRAEMGVDVTATARPLLRKGDEVWQGPIFLPANERRRIPMGRYFLAKLAGVIEVFPFLPAVDRFTVQPGSGPPTLQSLPDSQFTPAEWQIRRDAAHAKSKTFGPPAV